MSRIARIGITALLSLLTTLAHAALPESGWYWNATESGRGFNLEIQDNALFMAAFAYRADGSAVWYVTGGPMSSDRSYSGDLYETSGGQCFGCGYRPASLLPVGRASITFTSERSANISLLGSTIAVVRQDWSNSGALSRDALFGEWSTVEGDPSFPVYFADRISLHTPGTSSSGAYAGGNITGSSSNLAVGLYNPGQGVYSMLVDSSTSYYSFYVFNLNGLNRIEGVEWTYRKTEQPTGSGTYFLAHRTKSYARVRGLNAPGVSKATSPSFDRDAMDAARAARSQAKTGEALAFEELAIDSVQAMARELEAQLAGIAAVNAASRTNAALSLVLVLALPGCATRIAADPNERPTLVDPARTDMGAYRRDYGECAALANQVDAGEVAGSGAAAGAVAGALVGTLIGAVIGYAVNDTATGMRVGASLGGIEGALGGSSGAYGAARADQEGALRNCLRGRGYNLIR